MKQTNAISNLEIPFQNMFSNNDSSMFKNAAIISLLLSFCLHGRSPLVKLEGFRASARGMDHTKTSCRSFTRVALTRKLHEQHFLETQYIALGSLSISVCFFFASHLFLFGLGTSSASENTK